MTDSMEQHICQYIKLENIKKDNIQKQKDVGTEHKKLTDRIIQDMKSANVNCLPLHDGSFLTLKRKEVYTTDKDFEMVCYQQFQQLKKRMVPPEEATEYIEFKKTCKKKLMTFKEHIVRSRNKPIDMLLQ